MHQIGKARSWKVKLCLLCQRWSVHGESVGQRRVSAGVGDEITPSDVIQFSYLSLFAFTRHPGCTCAEGFSGPHCEFLQTAPLTTVESLPEGNEDTNKGPRVGLAVTFFVLVALVAGAFIHKYHSRSQIEMDTGKERPSTPTSDVSPSGSADYMEDVVDMQTVPVDDNAVRTSEII
jgi:hypothetical protein